MKSQSRGLGSHWPTRPMRLTRRRWFGRVRWTGAAALASACAQIGGQPGQGPAAKRSSVYTVRVQVWGDVQDKDLYETIAGDYNAAHTDVRVENDHQAASGPGVPGFYDKFAAGLAAGTAADLVFFQGWMWQEYAGKGALQPLDEFASRDRWTSSWTSDENYDLQTKFRGKRYLSPSDTGTMVLFYVKEYFDKAGLAYPKADWTHADFTDLTRKLTRQIDGKGVYGYQWNGGYLRNTPWWRMNNQLEWDRIAEPKKAFWNSAAVIEAYQSQLYDPQYKLQTAPTQAMLVADPRYNRIEFGGAAMKMEGPWFLPRMWGPLAQCEGGTHYDVQLLPRAKASKTPHLSLMGGHGMTELSKDHEAAWDVMKWVGSENGQRRVAETGRMCNVPELSRKFWLPATKSKYNVANAEVFLKATETGTLNLVGQVTENIILRDTGLGDALNSIRDGKATAKEALDQVQPRIQQVLDAYWASQPAGR